MFTIVVFLISFRKKVISPALLTHKDPGYRQDTFYIEQCNFVLNFKFPLAKIINYITYDLKKEYKLNPFSILVQAY